MSTNPATLPPLPPRDEFKTRIAWAYALVCRDPNMTADDFRRIRRNHEGATEPVEASAYYDAVRKWREENGYPLRSVGGVPGKPKGRYAPANWLDPVEAIEGFEPVPPHSRHTPSEAQDRLPFEGMVAKDGTPFAPPPAFTGIPPEPTPAPKPKRKKNNAVTLPALHVHVEKTIHIRNADFVTLLRAAGIKDLPCSTDVLRIDADHDASEVIVRWTYAQ